MRTHFKHSVELVDREGEIADHLAGVTSCSPKRLNDAAVKCWPNERIRLRRETRIVADSAEP